MNMTKGPAAPASGTQSPLHPDPEIALLLDFQPVPRKVEVEGGWSPEKQREFIARLALLGSPNKVCDEMGRNRTGVTKLYKSPHGASFRAAWDRAVEFAKRRKAERNRADFVSPGIKPPSLDHRWKFASRSGEGPLPGQVPNEYGEWEDGDSLARRGEDALDSMRRKLLNCRRHYLQEISGSPGKRAAFEILTELPIDWEKAAAFEPQEDEPWHKTNQRQPDMILTAESGWSFGAIGYGPERKVEMQQVIDDHRAEEGLPPVEW